MYKDLKRRSGEAGVGVFARTFSPPEYNCINQSIAARLYTCFRTPSSAWSFRFPSDFLRLRRASVSFSNFPSAIPSFSPVSATATADPESARVHLSASAGAARDFPMQRRASRLWGGQVRSRVRVQVPWQVRANANWKASPSANRGVTVTEQKTRTKERHGKEIEAQCNSGQVSRAWSY